MAYTFGNLDPTAPDSRPLSDANMGPLLIVWLWIVSNPDWQNVRISDPLSADGVRLANKLNLTLPTVLAIRNRILSDPGSFQGVSAEFQTLAGIASYPVGPTCPGSIDPLLALG